MSNDTYDRATVDTGNSGGRLSRVWDTLANLQQNVETVVRQSRFEISGGGVDQVDAPDDLDELVDLAKSVGFVWQAYDVFANEVWEPGYRLEGPDKTVAYFMGDIEDVDAEPPEGTPDGGFLANCGVFAGEKEQDFYDVGKAATFQRRLRGTVLAERLKKNPKQADSEITGYYFIRPETVSAEVYPNQNILIDPGDTDVDGVETTKRGEAAAYIQFDDDSILGRRGTFQDEEEIPLSQNDVHKQVLNPGIGDDAGAEQGVFGTPGLEPISEDIAEYIQIKRDRATAIGNKAHGIWLIEHGREVLDLGDTKELIEWDDDSMGDFEKELEDINPGGYVTHDGSVSPERVDGDVPDLESTIQNYIDDIFSGLPVSKYKVGFEDDINRDVTSEQSDSDQRQVEEEREYQERQWTEEFKEVARRKGLPTEGLQLKIEPEPEDSPVKSMSQEEIEKLATYADALNSLAGPQGGPQTLVDRETLLTDIAQLPEDTEMGDELVGAMEDAEGVEEEQEALWRELTIESGDTGNRDALADDGSQPFADVPVIPTGIEELTPAWLIRWAEWVAAGKPEIPEKDALDWNPALHPRNPKNGKFVERSFNVPDDLPDFESMGVKGTLEYLDEQGEDVDAILDPESGVTIDGVPNDAQSIEDIPDNSESDFAFGDPSEEAANAISEVDALIESGRESDNPSQELEDMKNLVDSQTGLETDFVGDVEQSGRAAKEIIRLDDAGQTDGLDVFKYSGEPSHIGRKAGSYSRMDDTVIVNPKIVESGELAEWAEENKIGGDTVEWVVRHEVGHARHRETMSVDESRSVRGAKFDSEEESEIEDALSRYAASKPTEFIAEAYAAKASGEGELPGFLEGTYEAFNGPEVNNG